MSDGTSTLTFLDPKDYSQVKQIAVTSKTGPIEHLNELEYIDGVIYANIWQSDQVVLINPKNGDVIGWIDFSDLRSHLNAEHQIDVLNGIAFNQIQAAFDYRQAVAINLCCRDRRATNYN